MKNGAHFLTIVEEAAYKSGTWDPYAYRETVEHETLGHFVTVAKISGERTTAAPRFAAIEYRHVHRGMVPAFILEPVGATWVPTPVVGEAALLFGTMRAYLGNAVVTPKGSWIGEPSPLSFAVKSEFVLIEPRDGFHYFWWAFLKSAEFLQSLPVGSGDTRPRLLTDQLLRTPIAVPNLPVREKIHRAISEFAESQWRGGAEIDRLLCAELR